MTDLPSYLVSGQDSGKISPESLEQMGKEAATLLLQQGVPLNDSISKMAAAHFDLNAEHVKRICEFANNATYVAKHEKSKLSGAQASYPQFVLADPSMVIQDLSDGARPTKLTTTDLDYSRLPRTKEKLSDARAFNALAEAFGVGSAKEDLPHSPESGVNDLLDAKSQLVGLRDNLSTTNERMDLMRQEVAERYYDSVKRHLLDGGGFEDVANAAASADKNEEKVSRTLQPFVARLLKEKVSSAEVLRQGVADKVKVAHRILNQEHPFVDYFKTLISLDDELEKVAMSLEDVSHNLGRINAEIKEQTRARASR